jgi:TRAP-type C4-dicarboxylate transport system permease small subunit
VPLWLVQALIPLGGVLLLIVALHQIVRWACGQMPIEEERQQPDTHE